MDDVICANAENDFSILDDGPECIGLNADKLATCANKALYSILKRSLEKWIENEHFELKMDAEDCK